MIFKVMIQAGSSKVLVFGALALSKEVGGMLKSNDERFSEREASLLAAPLWQQGWKKMEKVGFEVSIS